MSNIDLEALKSLFVKQFGQPAQLFHAFAPGRVNIIGEHTDYNHGFVFPCGLDAHMNLIFAPRRDSLVTVHAVELKQTATVDLKDASLEKKQYYPRYMHYIVGPGVAMRGWNNGKPAFGFDAICSSTIPIGAGVSSSSALCVASALAYKVANPQINVNGTDFLMLICESEWTWSGVRGGIMDQFTSLNAKQGCAFVLDCRTQSIHPKYLHLPLPKDLVLVLANTNVKHDLVGTPYNDRRHECESAAEAIASVFPNKKITHLRDADIKMLNKADQKMNGRSYRRALHVINEDIRTIKCAEALIRGDLKTAGMLVNESHDSLRDHYEVSCEELDTMVDIARTLKGVYGARMMGGGFGGSCVLLVDPIHVNTVVNDLGEQYRHRIGREATIMVTRPGAGASVKPLSISSKL